MTQEKEVLKLALEALRKARRKVLTTEECHAVIMSIKEALAQPEQKQAIISLTDQCAALVWERDELQKQVWLYEKSGVTCQTYRHTVEQSCSEYNVQMDYTAHNIGETNE